MSIEATCEARPAVVIAVAARERARDHTRERYGERLIGALKTLDSGH